MTRRFSKSLDNNYKPINNIRVDRLIYSSGPSSSSGQGIIAWSVNTEKREQIDNYTPDWISSISLPEDIGDKISIEYNGPYNPEFYSIIFYVKDDTVLISKRFYCRELPEGGPGVYMHMAFLSIEDFFKIDFDIRPILDHPDFSIHYEIKYENNKKNIIQQHGRIEPIFINVDLYKEQKYDLTKKDQKLNICLQAFLCHAGDDPNIIHTGILSYSKITEKEYIQYRNLIVDAFSIIPPQVRLNFNFSTLQLTERSSKYKLIFCPLDLSEIYVQYDEETHYNLETREIRNRQINKNALNKLSLDLIENYEEITSNLTNYLNKLNLRYLLFNSDELRKWGWNLISVLNQSYELEVCLGNIENIFLKSSEKIEKRIEVVNVPNPELSKRLDSLKRELKETKNRLSDQEKENRGLIRTRIKRIEKELDEEVVISGDIIEFDIVEKSVDYILKDRYFKEEFFNFIVPLNKYYYDSLFGNVVRAIKNIDENILYKLSNLNDGIEKIIKGKINIPIEYKNYYEHMDYEDKLNLCRDIIQTIINKKVQSGNDQQFNRVTQNLNICYKNLLRSHKNDISRRKASTNSRIHIL